jgi:hypothetical protein
MDPKFYFVVLSLGRAVSNFGRVWVVLIFLVLLSHICSLFLDRGIIRLNWNSYSDYYWFFSDPF